MNFPYGVSDFALLMREGYFYVDRTDRIPAIEKAGRQLVFLRPRRFGKSLLLSMLEHYYDLAKAEEFEQIFGTLAIGQQATALHNQYFVLKWDFSMVSPQGDSECITRSLFAHINGEIAVFAEKYSSYWQHPIEIDKDNAIASLRSVLGAVQQTSHKLYLLIDEYDNFANEIVMGSSLELGKRRYQELLQGEGILKTVFKAVKAAAAGRGLDRVFITGVSPLVLSDMTSGYNVAENIFLNSEFNDLCGFTESEIRETLQDLVQTSSAELPTVQDILALMRSCYNGYCFMETDERPQERVYNPTLALYFLKKLLHDGRYPSNMLDDNLAMDRGKLSYIAALPQGAELIQTAIEHHSPLAIETLVQRFGIEDIIYGKKDEAFMISFLYFFGILTLEGRDDFGDLTFGVPNQVILRLYLHQLRECLLPNWDAATERNRVRAFYREGAFQPVCEFIEQRILPTLSNRDYAQVNELTVKTAFLLLLFNDHLYHIESEASAGRGYADLTLLVRSDCRRYNLLDWVIEFKYVSLKSLGLSGEELKQLTREQYTELPLVREAIAAAELQLRRYAGDLRQKYGGVLNLRAYAVVSLGLERLVGCEVS